MIFPRYMEALRGGATLEAAMDFQYFWKGGGSQTQSTSIPKFQQDAMKNLYSQADNIQFDDNYGGSAGFNPVAGMTPEQQAALGSISGTGTNLQGVYDNQGVGALKDALGTYDPNKTGLNGAIDAVNSRLNWDYDTNVAGNIRQGAQDSGQYGSTRHGVAEGIARSQLSQQKMDAANSLAFQDQQNFNNQRNAMLQNLGQVTSGMTSGSGAVYDAGALKQKQQQAEIQGQLEKWAYENNVDAEELKLYMQAVNGSGSAGSTTTTSGGGPSKGQSALAGAAGGASAGFMVGGPMGAGIGAGVGAIGGLMG